MTAKLAASMRTHAESEAARVPNSKRRSPNAAGCAAEKQKKLAAQQSMPQAELDVL
jgi:hypothetical protein